MERERRRQAARREFFCLAIRRVQGADLTVLLQALALLGASTASPLSSISALLPIPSPAPYLEHVARIAHDLSKASGGEGQGVRYVPAFSLVRELMDSDAGRVVQGSSTHRDDLRNGRYVALPPLPLSEPYEPTSRTPPHVLLARLALTRRPNDFDARAD